MDTIEVPHCRRQIFAERFGEDVVPLRRRRTARLEHIVHHLGLALGGRPAASFAKRLMLPVSNDTLLRVVRRRTAMPTDPLLVVGIDDWAFRRNRRYGTIVCDLERRIVALLLCQMAGVFEEHTVELPVLEPKIGLGVMGADAGERSQM